MTLRNRGKSHFKPKLGRLVAGWPLQLGPRIQLAYKKSNWLAVSRPSFHGIVAAVSGLERRSNPGAVRSHYRRRRLAALEFYARAFGPVPSLLLERHLRSGPAFYRTEQYKAWSVSAHSSPQYAFGS